MNPQTIKGIGFGLTTGILTTLGLIVGLDSFTDTKLIIIGGILTIAIADAFSDALGMHISEESEKSKSHKDVWVATIATFLTKVIFSSTFIIPVVLFEIGIAIWVSIAWGLFGLIVLNYFIAREKGEKPFKMIFEHLLIAIVVLIIIRVVTTLISGVFG